MGQRVVMKNGGNERTFVMKVETCPARQRQQNSKFKNGAPDVARCDPTTVLVVLDYCRTVESNPTGNWNQPSLLLESTPST